MSATQIQPHCEARVNPVSELWQASRRETHPTPTLARYRELWNVRANCLYRQRALGAEIDRLTEEIDSVKGQLTDEERALL